MLRRPHDHHRDLRAQLPAALPTIDDNRRHQDRYVMTATTGLRPRRVDLASCCSSTGCHHARSTAPCGHQRKPATATQAAVPTINPSCCCLPVALLLAPRRIALFRAHLRRQPNPHSQGRGASAHHRPRVRSLAAAFGRRPTCTWLRRSSPASETLHTSGPSYLRNSRRKTCRRVPARPTS
jgi:hypothetical protein